jgi:hypothetical protein
MERDRAWDLLTEFTQSDSLRKHALAVEAAMRPTRPATARPGDGAAARPTTRLQTRPRRSIR